MGDWNKYITASDSRLDLPGKGPLFELDFNKWWEGGRAKCGHYSCHSLGHCLSQAWVLCQIWHWSKSLSHCKACALLEWSFIISIAVSSDHSQLRCTGFAGSH